MTNTESPALTVVAQLRAKPGKEQTLREALTALVAPTTREPGCVTYDLHVDVDDPAAFCFYEVWSTPADHAANLQTTHLQAFAAQLDDLLDGELHVSLLRHIA
ncbi:putative quinol monooxygenase [Streptomyces graminilatus]|uniref:putative quinol monooxygenase n=1 Tax=Streptomyces graminilatus TaxID=1464070 RepID=UPI0006E1CAB6|nr:putative quinol monooxygenase [Streptomyces graminilatus]